MDQLSFEDLNNMDLPSLDRVDVLEHLRIVRFKGAVDKETLADLLDIKEKLAQTSDINNMNLLFDFQKVTHVDRSTAIQLLNRVTELQQENKHLGLMNVPQELPDIIEHHQMETSEPIQIFRNEEEAVTYLNKA